MKPLARRPAAAAAALVLCAAAARADDWAARGFDADTTRPALGVTRGIAVETAAADAGGELGRRPAARLAPGLPGPHAGR